MKIFGLNITREQRSLENPAVPLSSPEALAMFFGDGGTSDAGELVTVERALGVPAVWCAVNFLADTIASLPLKLYRRTGDVAEPDTNDPLYRLLHDAPTPEITSYRWRESFMNSTLTVGRSFTFIERSPSGRVLNLWPLEQGRVSVTRQEGRLLYRVEGDTLSGVGAATYAANEIIDLPFMLKDDGVGHYSPLWLLRNSIGLAIALEGYASRFFAGGGTPPMQLVGPFTGPEGAARASHDVAKALREARKSNKNVLPLPTGHELKPIGVKPEEGQMMDARRLQIEEVSRIYNIPPSFLHDLTRATFSNHEQAALSLVKHSLAPWLRKIEGEFNLKLFGRDDASRFVKFSLDGLLRGDFATRMSGYATAVQNAIRTPDEIRERPAPPYAADLVGTNLLRGSAAASSNSATAAAAGDSQPSSSTKPRLRATRVAASSADGLNPSSGTG